MGSASSKAARGGAARKFPTRSPGSAVSQTQTASRAPRQAAAQDIGRKPDDSTKGDGSKDASIISDSMDPDFTPQGFSNRLHQMGIVDPSPTYSPSSTAGPHQGGKPQVVGAPVFPSAKQNTTLSVLEARSRLQQQADEDMEAFSRVGNKAQRRFADMRTLVDAIQLQDRGMAAAEVERKLGLKAGLLEKFGERGVLTHLTR